MTPDEALAATRTIARQLRQEKAAQSANPDEELSPDWRDGGYPYLHLMQRRNYEEQKYQLQVELLKLQAWVKETGQKVVVLFEGRDAAGKGAPSSALWNTSILVEPALWRWKSPLILSVASGISSAT